MTEKLTHPSVLATAVTGVVLAALQAGPGLPWWTWAAWAVLGCVAVGQAARA